MPEGDSIYQLSRRLQFMVGRTVLAADVRVPRHATANLSGPMGNISLCSEMMS